MFQRIPTHLVVTADDAGWPVIRAENDDCGPNLAIINPANFPTLAAAFGMAEAIREGLITQRWRDLADLEREGGQHVARLETEGLLP